MNDKFHEIFETLVKEGLIKTDSKNAEGEEVYDLTLKGAEKIVSICKDEFYDTLIGGSDGKQYSIAPGEDVEDVEFEFAKLAVESAGGPVHFLVGYYLGNG